MKQTDIKPCLVCGEGVMHAGHVTFYRVKVERMMVNLPAVRRQAGLETFLGSPAIAFHMGAQEDMASALPNPTEGLVCESCAIRSGLAQFCEEAKGGAS